MLQNSQTKENLRATLDLYTIVLYSRKKPLYYERRGLLIELDEEATLR